MNRDEFLARVKQAVRAGQAHRAHVRRDLASDAGYVGGGDDLCQRLADEVVGVGGAALVVQEIEAARRALGELLRELGPQAALSWRHPLLERLDLDGLLAGLGVERWDHARLAGLAEPERRATILAAGVGITSVAWAVAETGTLAVAAGPGRERVASLLPPVHVALVAESQIVPDLYDLFALLEGGRPRLRTRSVSEAKPQAARTADLTRTRSASEQQPTPPSSSNPSATTFPSNLALITGPSKTGDIELQLTTGVHGPGAVSVIVVRGE